MNQTLNKTLPNQRVSIKEKATPKWTKDMANYVISLALMSNDKSKTKTFLDMANGKVNKDMYEYVLKTFGTKGEDLSNSKDHSKLIADLREINILQPIKDRYLGEFTSAYDNYQVYTDDPDTIFIRNKDYGEQVLAVMQQMVINNLNREGIDTGQQSKPVPDLDKMFEEFIAKWDDNRADEAQKRLNLLNNEIDAKLKYNQAYYYWWACEEVYTKRNVNKGNVEFEIISPLNYYRVDSGNTYVEDDEYGLSISFKTLYQILDQHGKHLSEKDISYLKNYTSENINVDTRINILKSRCIEHGMSEEDFIDYSKTYINNFENPDLIPVVHYFAKTEVKIGYLTYYNPQGEVDTMMVDETYKLDETNGDLDIKWDWLQQIYEGEVIGYNLASSKNLDAIYTSFRPIDIQRENFTNLNRCKAPYNGISYIHRDSSKAPIPYRVNPYLALYRIYHYQIEKAIQKWKNILAIPQSLLNENEEMSLEQRLAYMDSENLLVFNDAEVNANVLQAMREIATNATYNYVNTLYQLLRGIKDEAWEVANMTPTRMGAQKAYQGKSVTEQSLAQTEISSNWQLEMFNMFRGKDYLANYDYSKVAWSEGKSGTYRDGSTNELVRVEVNPLEHVSLNIGINVGNSRLLDEKLKAMKEVAFSASQNGDFELATEAILNDNLQSLKRQILNAQEKRREYEAGLEAAKNQASIQAQEIARQTQVEKNQHEKDLEVIKADSKTNELLIQRETDLLVWELRLQTDMNGNGYVDDSEFNTEEYIAKAQLEREKINIKYQELALKRKSLQNKESKDK